jgi:putative methionine-R-sulfoxide reductase with GAF domain
MFATLPSPRGGAADEPRSERRLSPRRAVLDEQIVAITLNRDNGGLILDLCGHGLSVQAVAALQKGATAALEFVLPDTSAPIRGRGEVRWAEKSGLAGIRFLDLGVGSAEHLSTWLSKSATKPEPLRPDALAARPPVEETLDLARVEREISAHSLDLERTLQFVAERTRESAQATGIAIALGTPEEMICRASTGAAPGPGARLQSNSGLSGECVRTGLLVCCDNTESDARVDVNVCRQLDLRSAVLVPVFNAGKMCGVLEVFSNRPAAFTSHDIVRLRQIGDLIGEMVGRFRASEVPVRIDAGPEVETEHLEVAGQSMASAAVSPALPIVPETRNAPTSARAIPPVVEGLAQLSNVPEKIDALEAQLQAIAQKLMILTSADGAAVVLRTGESIVCRASVGMAPTVGAVFPQTSGLAGECVRTRTVVWCPDTNYDARVNREVCQLLNLRSTILAPVLHGSLVVGVLEVFSSRPNRFEREDVMALMRMAGSVAELLGK